MISPFAVKCLRLKALLIMTATIMQHSSDAIAEAVLQVFDSWPKKRKPLARSDGGKEWVPLSGIVAEGRESLTCLAVATGMKCLPQGKISQAQGVVLHDWHAEILAIRAFNRFLLDECHALASQKKESSDFIRIRSQDEINETHFQPFALNDGLKLHMYCSEAPCGDASMELTMASQEDATPWDISSTEPSISESSDESSTHTVDGDDSILHGRSYFSALGVVRRKPSRPDAPPTLSKSCSDKIALKQSTSLLSSITSLIISPENCYPSSLVLPVSQYSDVACKRAFSSSGRLAPLCRRKVDWGSYKFVEFDVSTTEKEFQYSRRQNILPDEKIVPSNISSFSTPHIPMAETLIGGTLQGRKQFSLNGASRVSKLSIWTVAHEIAITMSLSLIQEALTGENYASVKGSLQLTDRRKAKADTRHVLRGWVRNVGDEGFGLQAVNGRDSQDPLKESQELPLSKGS